MVEAERRVRPRRHLDWSQVSAEFKVDELTAFLYGVFSAELEKIKPVALEQGKHFSERAFQIVTAMLTEETADLAAALSLHGPVCFKISFELPPGIGGRTLVFADTIYVLLNGNDLIKVLEYLDQSLASPEQEVNQEAIPALFAVVFFLAHEMAHVRQYEQYPTVPSSTEAMGDAEKGPQTPEESASYIRNPFEANAFAVGINYLCRKGKIGSPLWQFIADEECLVDLIETVMSNGAYYDHLVMGRLAEESQELGVDDLIQLEALSRKAGILLKRIQKYEERVDRMSKRMKQLLSKEESETK